MRVLFSLSVCIAVITLLSVSGCRTAKGDTPGEKRAYALKMRDDALTELYKERPDAKKHVEGAPGYAV